MTYLCFALGADELAVPVARVREIIELSPVSRVPGAPACVRGVLSHRGQIVPLIDLHQKLFGRSVELASSRRTGVVLVEVELDHEASVLGLLVDEVLNLREVTAAEIVAAPPSGTPVRGDLLVGLLHDGARVVSLLDVTRLLSMAELYAAQDAGPPPAASVP